MKKALMLFERKGPIVLVLIGMVLSAALCMSIGYGLVLLVQTLGLSA